MDYQFTPSEEKKKNKEVFKSGAQMSCTSTAREREKRALTEVALAIQLSLQINALQCFFTEDMR